MNKMPKTDQKTESHRDLLSRLANVQAWLSRDAFGGPRLWRLSRVINFQKGGTCIFVLLLMYVYRNHSMDMWVYLALHGSYGLCWVGKDACFPDPNWQKPVTIGGSLFSFGLVLGPYWIGPWLLASGIARQGEPAASAILALAIAIHTLGLGLMLAADCQKHFTLKYRPGYLVTEGVFSRVRHPNYLGEIMIYASYAILVGHWLPWTILAFIWGGLFSVNIAMKERSLSRYPEWQEYKQRTGLLWPRWR